jgi:allantoinase
MAAPFDRVVRGTLVLPDRTLPNGWVAFAGELIAAVGAGGAPAAGATDDHGDALIFPGFVDGQTHATSYKGLSGFEATSRAAVAGGVTTFVDMPYDNPDPLNTVERLAAKIAAVERHSCADVALYATIAPGQGTAEMAPLAEAGVCAFKISSFESHPVRFPRLPADDMRAILEASVATGLPVGLHNEDQEIVRGAIAALKRAGRTTPEWHEPSRPLVAEMAATAHFLELGLLTGARVHVVHISHPRGYDLVSRYRAEGTRATAEMCVHYLHFDNARDVGRLGARMKVSPPIRDGVVDALWRCLADGKVDLVSSDHSSWPVDNKLVPSIFDAGAGIPGLETLVPSFFTDLAGRVADPARTLVWQVCEGPARLFGLWPRKGALLPGADADVAVLRPGRWLFDASRTRDDLNWSPYDGEEFSARIAATYVRGLKVWDGENRVGAPGPRPLRPTRGVGVDGVSVETFERSLWSALAAPPPGRPPLAGDVDTEVLVVGAGFLGLSLALHLAESGIRATVLEAKEVGYGASGRNTGFVVPSLQDVLGAGRRAPPARRGGRAPDGAGRRVGIARLRPDPAATGSPAAPSRPAGCSRPTRRRWPGRSKPGRRNGAPGGVTWRSSPRTRRRGASGRRGTTPPCSIRRAGRSTRSPTPERWRGRRWDSASPFTAARRSSGSSRTAAAGARRQPRARSPPTESCSPPTP